MNGYATLDAGYQTVRVASKPALTHGPAHRRGFPSLGCSATRWRNWPRILAGLDPLGFRGNGYAVPGGTILRAPPAAVTLATARSYAAVLPSSRPRVDRAFHYCFVRS